MSAPIDGELDNKLREILPPELLDSIGAKEEDFYPAIKALVQEAKAEELKTVEGWLMSARTGDLIRILGLVHERIRELTPTKS